MEKQKCIFEKIEAKDWNRFLVQLAEKNISIDLIDIQALSPKDTTLEVLYQFIKEQYGIILNQSINEIKSQEEKFNLMIKAEIQQQERIAELEFMKSLEQIDNDKTSDIIEEVYYVPKQLAKMVAKGFSTGLILFGNAGLGKTYSVLRAFKEENADFIYSCGFSTPLEFYNFLYEHRAKHLIFDDVSNLLKSAVILDLLKSALYSPKGTRIVAYQSTSTKLLVPKQFEFTGTITLLLNKIQEGNADLNAVLDRVLHHELKIDYLTILKVLKELSNQPYKELTDEERRAIVKWIAENTTIATKNLNLRLLFKLYDIYRYNKVSWERLAKEVVENDNAMLIVKKMLDNNISVKNACHEFTEQGYGSERTFYRIKAKLKGESY